MAQFAKTRFVPTPPDKGSFPLDHDGLCKELMGKYMKCLSSNKQDNTKCREEIKTYLDCRMNNNLMAKEDWKMLGLDDVKSKSKVMEQ